LAVPWWVWLGFAVGVLAVLVLDLALFHRQAHEVSVREAAVWSLAWIVAAVGFAGVLWAWEGGTAAEEYLAGYLIERSLSIDNVFVFAVIFGYFAVPAEYRQRALLWGIMGALVLRTVFIALGAVALERFAWVAWVLGLFLIATGVRLAVRELDPHPERNPVLALARRWVPMSEGYHGQRLVVRIDKRLLATPMVAVLVALATTDVAFAMDSIPAVFAVTEEPFIVFAANAFALLGLLALYFLIAGLLRTFPLLRPALALILVFVGVKMLLGDAFPLSSGLSLAVIGAVLGAGTLLSLWLLREPAIAVASRGPAPSSPPSRAGSTAWRGSRPRSQSPRSARSSASAPGTSARRRPRRTASGR
jgi:tellurite resistance protein TerC